MVTKIKLLVICDETINYLDEVKEGLRLQNEEYKIATDGDIEIESTLIQRNLSQVPWIDYYGGNYGVDYGWLAQDTKGMSNDFYSVAYVFEDAHWSKLGNQSIWGWNAGFYNGFSVQLIRAVKGRTVSYPNGETHLGNFIAFYEELMHSWDDILYSKLKVDLEEYFGVVDYDETIVHGHPTGDNFERWKYRDAIKAIKPFLLQLFGDGILEKMRYVIVANQQYLLYDTLKIAFSIGDIPELVTLQAQGLKGDPEQLDNIDGYIVYPLVKKERLKDLFNF